MNKFKWTAQNLWRDDGYYEEEFSIVFFSGELK